MTNIKDVLLSNPDTCESDWENRGGAWIHVEAEIGDRCHIGKGAIIGARAKIDYGATIGKWASVGNGAIIGIEAIVGNGTTVGDGVSVGAWVKIGTQALVGAMARVGECATVGEGAILAAREYLLTLYGVAEWGPISAHQQRGGGWRVSIGCQCFSYPEAVSYWQGKEHRKGTLRAVEMLRVEAIARGWEKA